MPENDDKVGDLPEDIAKKLQDLIKEMESREDVDPTFKDLTGKKLDFKLKDGEVAWYVAYKTTG